MADYSLTEGKGTLVAHRPDCPVVQVHRDKGLPIMTMFGVKGPLGNDVAKCECLRDERATRS